MASKSTEAEIEIRTAEVFTLLVAGVKRGEIVRHGSKKWGITSRQVDDYIAWASKEIKAQAQFDREHELGKAIARLNHLYVAAEKNGDHRTSLAVVKETSTLLGLAEAQKIEISGALNIAAREWIDSIEQMDADKKAADQK